MILKNTRFGDIEIDADKIISFPQGIIGLEGLRRFVLLETGSALKWLQSVDEPSFAFVLAHAGDILPDYLPELNESQLASAGAEKPEDVEVCLILTVPSDPLKTTANTMAPVIINIERKTGAQVILCDDRYSVRQRVFPEGGDRDVDPVKADR